MRRGPLPPKTLFSLSRCIAWRTRRVCTSPTRGETARRLDALETRIGVSPRARPQARGQEARGQEVARQGQEEPQEAARGVRTRFLCYSHDAFTSRPAPKKATPKKSPKPAAKSPKAAKPAAKAKRDGGVRRRADGVRADRADRRSPKAAKKSPAKPASKAKSPAKKKTVAKKSPAKPKVRVSPSRRRRRSINTGRAEEVARQT